MTRQLDYTAERDLPDVDYMQPRFMQGFFAYVFARPYAVGRRVLDAGCGEGYGTDYLAEVARWAVGVDLDVTCVQVARRRYTRPNLTFASMDLCRMGFSTGSMDLVVSFAVIEHIEDYEAYLRELARVTHPDGVVILEALNRQTPISLDPWHYKEFNASELRTALGTFFGDVELWGMVGKTPRATAYRQKRERVIRWVVQLGGLQLRRRLSRSAYLRLYLTAQRALRVWLWKRHLRTQGLTPEDFTVIQEDIERAWSFFAVCRQPLPVKPRVFVGSPAVAQALRADSGDSP
ncbi:MAG: class I SAM-dependent methyltransferase [Acidobacteria bacterium]|nr:class I SAM-dependent methyltransferase [Acidobacteriota bacterium]MDW7985177.1 class I SAM-dependent methyltransferase [Acidobacteriota bacterium]